MVKGLAAFGASTARLRRVLVGRVAENNAVDRKRHVHKRVAYGCGAAAALRGVALSGVPDGVGRAGTAALKLVEDAIDAAPAARGKRYKARQGNHKVIAPARTAFAEIGFL